MSKPNAAPPIILDETTYRGLQPSMRATLALLVFCQRPVRAESIARLMRGVFRTISDTTAQGLLEVMARQRLVAGPLSGRKWQLGARVTCAALLAMAREYDDARWRPSAATVAAAFAEPDPYGFYGARRIDADFQACLGEALVLFAGGFRQAPTPRFVETLRGSHGEALARATAMAACETLADAPAEFALHKGDPLLALCAPWLCLAFIEGRDARVMTDALGRALDGGVRLAIDLQRAFAAVCAWQGDRTRLANACLSPTDPVVAGCRALAEGRVAEADKSFRGYEQLIDRGDASRNFDNFPARALAAAVAACVKPEKIQKMHPARLLGGHLAYEDRVASPHPRTQAYANAVREVSLALADGWKAVVDGKGLWLAHLAVGAPCNLAYALNYAWDYHQLAIGRRAAQPKGLSLLGLAHGLADRGWATVARLMAALLNGAYDAAAEQAFLTQVDAAGFFLFPSIAPEPEWKALLKALRKAVGRAASSEGDDAESAAKPAETLLWSVALGACGGDTYDVATITPVLRPPNGPADGARDRSLRLSDLSAKEVRPLVGEKDMLVAKTLQASGTLIFFGSSEYSSSGVREAVGLLCGRDNVVRRDAGAKKSIPIVLERRRCEMETEVGEDGGLVLKTPAWAFGAVGGWVLRKLGAHRFAYVEVPAEAKKLLQAFNDFGEDGRLQLPREAMGEAADVVNAMTAVLPVAERTGDAAAALRRVPAASGVRVRLDFVDGTLVVRAVVLPVPENGNLQFEPGVGLAEKVVAAVAGSYVLVRDLDAERKAFAPVKDALADCEAWAEGAAAWRIDDLAAALSALAALKALGDAVPLEWVNDRTLRVTNAPASKVKLASSRTADDWFRVEGQFPLDDGRVLSVIEMLEAAKSRTGKYVKLSNGDYVALTKEMARELDALNAAGRRKGDALEVVKAAVPMLDGVFGEGADEIALPDAMAVTAAEIRAAFAKRPATPVTLNAELRPYQEKGYQWLSRLAACGFGACLADDMGLGKTIQVICLLLERAAAGPSLVVAPSSVCGNWRSELGRFAPTLHPVMAHEGDAPAAAKPGDVVITSYGYLLFHEAEFQSVTWNGVILDEAQAIKNDASKRAKAVKLLHARFRVAATGTPVENRLGELWSLFDFLNPGLLGPAASFATRFTNADGKATSDLKRLVKPLILRRLKGDVLDDLPEKTEITIPVALGATERSAYEGCRLHALAALDEKDAEGGAGRMKILAELTRLRRFCCHPSLVLPGQDVPSAKMEALVELLEGLREGRHRALVFSQFTDYLALVRKVIDARGWSHLYLDGATPTLEREKLVNAFQGGEGDFFLISLKAGGTGLNLTAANYVILLDPWWNPAVENQAADRAHRIGQRNPVTVYRLIASDTVEARVVELHKEKIAIAEDVLDGTGSAALSPAQLMKLFG